MLAANKNSSSSYEQWRCHSSIVFMKIQITPTILRVYLPHLELRLKEERFDYRRNCKRHWMRYDGEGRIVSSGISDDASFDETSAKPRYHANGTLWTGGRRLYALHFANPSLSDLIVHRMIITEKRPGHLSKKSSFWKISCNKLQINKCYGTTCSTGGTHDIERGKPTHTKE